MDRLLKQYSAKLTLVVHNYPLPMHSNAFSAAKAALAAKAQGKFWPMHNALLTGGALDRPEILAIAHKLGLNQRQFVKAWQTTAASVQADIRIGDAVGVKGTPTLFLCTPQSQVWRISSFSQIKELLQ